MSAQKQRKRAAILAIGDEILSGRTRDANIHFLAQWLTERGIELVEARIVGDDKQDIVDALNNLRGRYDYVFTSGGIGPTHDDITVDAIATAFGVEVIEHPEAAAIIRNYYKSIDKEATPARMRMAKTPDGAVLIDNPVSGAPGVRIDNVFVMAGVPRIFQGMLNAIESEIEKGAVVHSLAVTAHGLPESQIADQLGEIQEALNGVSIGSYPIDGDLKGVTIIARSDDLVMAQSAIAAVSAAMRAFGAEPVEGDH